MAVADDGATRVEVPCLREIGPVGKLSIGLPTAGAGIAGGGGGRGGIQGERFRSAGGGLALLVPMQPLAAGAVLAITVKGEPAGLAALFLDPADVRWALAYETFLRAA